MPKQPIGSPVSGIASIISQTEPYNEKGARWRSTAQPERSIKAGSLTIVCGGNRKQVIGQSLNMAREICETEYRQKDPYPFNPEWTDKQSVLYINTMANREAIANECMGLWPGVQEWSIRRDRHVLPNPARKQNLKIYDVAVGEFIDQLGELKQDAKFTSVVILNSFEFACRTARHRDDLVFQLIAMRDQGKTVIVFTQEEKRKVEKQARGPLALLRMQADDVLDHSVFTELQYAEPVGSTHVGEPYDYYKAHEQTGEAYLQRLQALLDAEGDEEKIEAILAGEMPVSSGEEDLPDRVTAAEIEDTVRDVIHLPNEFESGGICNSEGEMLFADEVAPPQTMNSYRVMLNAYSPVITKKAA